MITDASSLRDWLNSKYDSNIEMRFLDLYSKYMSYPSVKRDVNKLEIVLRYNNVTNRQIDKILREYITNIVSPTIKSLVTGNISNSITKDIILGHFNGYEIEFNMNYEYKFVDIPSWYIRDKENNKIVIGYNHYDISKASKYIVDEDLHSTYEHNNIRVLNVVCNVSFIIDNIGKCYEIMKYGLNSNRVCYVNDLIRTVEYLLEN
jgi:predicted nuclease of predicted toxin-antitoxin system